MEAAMRMIAGTARSMGLLVDGAAVGDESFDPSSASDASTPD